ncbi:hypothetical protein BofuT4_P143920.1 [Botrytis cinerea T4]|uniref:Uncharacterized protein n=1 Tax=Botryotinia fuckeliana (strain T4) TaxID=999810 RepID=G2YY86_BOTF4|nr:hypothetical protein BofuT4_P143920.1 [Botrytis cinerea T4]
MTPRPDKRPPLPPLSPSALPRTQPNHQITDPRPNPAPQTSIPEHPPQTSFQKLPLTNKHRIQGSPAKTQPISTQVPSAFPISRISRPESSADDRARKCK